MFSGGCDCVKPGGLLPWGGMHSAPIFGCFFIFISFLFFSSFFSFSFFFGGGVWGVGRLTLHPSGRHNGLEL